ncbi:MAG TPA: creatininase [Candidatus Acidoferrum sp.]|nr:creatininase [Candidatus Acidoferrum sp.]
MAREVFIERMSWTEVQKAAAEGYIVTLPIGSTEQHGPHLPLGTDVFIASGIAEKVASKVNMIIAPPISYGYYSQVRSGGGGERFPGTTSVGSSTLVGLISDVVGAFIKNDFKKLILLIGHFENYPLAAEGLQIALKSSGRTDVRALIVNWWELIPPEVLSEIYGRDFPGWETEHAAIAETSMMMALNPELVRTEVIRDYDLPRKTDYDIIPAPNDVIPKMGVPWKVTPASKRKGEVLIQTAVNRITEIVSKEF